MTQRRGAPGCDRYFLFPCRRRGCWCVRAWAGGEGEGTLGPEGRQPQVGARLRRGRAARPVRPPLPHPCRPLPSPSFPSPPHLGARPAPAAGARPGVAAPPPPAPRRKSPDSAGAATADPDPAPASAPVPASAPLSDSTPPSLPAPGRRGRARRRARSSPSAGAPPGPLLPLPDALREQASSPAGYPRPEPAPPAAPLRRGRCGAPRHPLLPAARAAATSSPASPPRSFVCCGCYRPLACAPRARLAAFVRGTGPAAPPGPPRPVPLPPRTWAARTAGLGRGSAFL